MILYFGTRPTGDNFHIGHVMSILNMFDVIKNNINEITSIYILMAETHAEISTIDSNIIKTNSISLANKVLALFTAYASVNIESPSVRNNLLNKFIFIYQNHDVGTLHKDITYQYLTLVNINSLISNPIFTNSENNSVAFAIYPVLQAFDVLLYATEHEPLTVFVSGDQHANINIMKDINYKLQLNLQINFNIYSNVIYDFSCKSKMSKSLNNFINFDDIIGLTTYFKKYITFNRPKITTVGEPQYCPFNHHIYEYFSKYLNFEDDHTDRCSAGTIGCGECKQNLIDNVIAFVNTYIASQGDDSCKNYKCVKIDDIIDRYQFLQNRINSIRSKNENS